MKIISRHIIYRLLMTTEISTSTSNEPTSQDAFKLLSNVDPDTGLHFEWLEIRDKLMNGAKVGDVLPLIFDYYSSQCESMDAWCIYLLTCSHFDPSDLDAPQNRFQRKRLEAKVKKLIKARKQEPNTNINEFMYKHQNIEV